MKVYYAGADPYANHGAVICPANDPLGIKMGVAAEWLTESGQPKTISIQFIRGETEVPDSIGKYLCATKMAKRTRLILPRGIAA